MRFPGPTQLHLYMPGLGRHEARNLPRPRGAASPSLGPHKVRRLIDDPRICPAAIRGQQTLFPIRRRFERAHARRISARTWPEEAVLYALAEQRAAKAGLAANWPYMVMRLIRCVLAIRDAEGEALIAPEVLDQVRLPLKETAAEILAQAEMLRPRTVPPPAAWPVGACTDCGSWGITTARCGGCGEWRHNPDLYPPGECPRCYRDGLPLHKEGLCRGCLTYVRECGAELAAVSFTQLAFAGVLAHQLKRRAGELGFVVHKRSGPVSRARDRARATLTREQVTSAPMDPGQLVLFTMPRTWQREPHAATTALCLLPDPAQKVLDAFTAGYPKSWIADKGSVVGGAALVLHTLLARVGPHAPIPERDVRSLAATVAAGTAATRSVISFLDGQALLEEDELSEYPAQLLTDAQRQVQTRIPDLGAERQDRHDERHLYERIAQLPEPMADQLRTWVRVMRGRGRFQHPPAGYRRIRHYLRIAWPALTSWATAGQDLRQITADDVRAELARHRGNVTRGLLSVLRSIFRALKQEQLIFRNPTVGIQASAGVHLPLPLSSDRLAGALNRLDSPAARLVVGLVAIHAVRAVEVARLDLADADLARQTLAVHRSKHTHTVYLDDLSVRLVTDWLRERRRRWPQATNPHLIITTHSYRHPASPQLSYCALRAAFDQIGLLPRQVWADRILYEAQETADPVHLVRLFGIHPNIAVKYVNAAHPDKALPRIRWPSKPITASAAARRGAGHLLTLPPYRHGNPLQPAITTGDGIVGSLRHVLGTGYSTGWMKNPADLLADLPSSAEKARGVADGGDGVAVVGCAGGDGDLHGRSVERDEPDVRVWVEASGGFGVQGYAAGCRHGSRYGGGVAQGAAVVGPVGGGAGPCFERGMGERGGQPRAVTEVGLGQTVGVGERGAGRDDHDSGHGQGVLEDEPVDGADVLDDAHVNPVAADRFVLVGQVQFGVGEGDVRIVAVHRRGQVRPAFAESESQDAQREELVVGGVAAVVFGEGVHGVEQGSGLGDQPLARRGEGHPAAGAFEQLGAQFPFQPLDVAAEGLGADVVPPRGPAEVQFLRQCHREAERPDVHACASVPPAPYRPHCRCFRLRQRRPSRQHLGHGRFTTISADDPRLPSLVR